MMNAIKVAIVAAGLSAIVAVVATGPRSISSRRKATPVAAQIALRKAAGGVTPV